MRRNKTSYRFLFIFIHSCFKKEIDINRPKKKSVSIRAIHGSYTIFAITETTLFIFFSKNICTIQKKIVTLQPIVCNYYIRAIKQLILNQ